jgi:hypothetical protein
MATNTTARTAAGATKVSTPWGATTLVEQAVLAQRVGDKRFACLFELLENARGEQFVRIAYATDGTARRGPVTLRARDLDRLRDALEKTPTLAALLDLGGGA